MQVIPDSHFIQVFGVFWPNVFYFIYNLLLDVDQDIMTVLHCYKFLEFMMHNKPSFYFNYKFIFAFESFGLSVTLDEVCNGGGRFG